MYISITAYACSIKMCFEVNLEDHFLKTGHIHVHSKLWFKSQLVHYFLDMCHVCLSLKFKYCINVHVHVLNVYVLNVYVHCQVLYMLAGAWRIPLHVHVLYCYVVLEQHIHDCIHVATFININAHTATLHIL